jgi:hypothetical protein
LETAWYLAKERHQFEKLEKPWICAEEQQLEPQEIRILALLSKNSFGNTVWHLTAERGHVDILDPLWNRKKNRN